MSVPRYWWNVASRAHCATFEWLFGDFRRSIGQLILFASATAILAVAGYRGQAREQIFWLIASAEAAILIYLITFSVFLFRVPAKIYQTQSSRIKELEAQQRQELGASFDITIQAVSEHSADRTSVDTETLFRIAIKNLSLENTFEAYAALENMPDELGISPAAKLRAMGEGVDSRNFHIAPTETVYLPFIERRTLTKGEPLLVFAAGAGFDSVPSIVVADLMREYARVGELAAGDTYAGTIAVYAKDAITSRKGFSVSVDSEGKVRVDF